MERFFLWILQSSLTATVIVLFIIIVLKLFDAHIGIRFRNALWIIVLIRLLVPIVPESRLSLFNLFSPSQQSTLNAQSINNIYAIPYFTYGFLREGKLYLKDGNNINYLNATKNNKQVYSEKNYSSKEKMNKENLFSFIFKISYFIWLSGVFIIALILITTIIKFKTKVMHLQIKADSNIENLLEECKKKANINRNIPIYICDNFKSPCIVGIIKPKIFLPKDICNINVREQLSYICLHELIHYKRKDLFYNVLCTMAVMIHWFNPIVWFVVKRMKLDRECACDSYVLEILGEDKSVEYGMTLINFSRFFSNNNKLPKLASFFETKNQIERRIKMIKKFKKGSYKMSAVAVICCIIVSSVTLTNSVTAKSTSGTKTLTTINNIDSVKGDNKFLIDSPLKSYDNIKKASQVFEVKFKLPDFLPEGYTASSCYQIIKINNNDNGLETFFNKSENGKFAGMFAFDISKNDISEFLKKSAEEHGLNKIEISKEPLKIAGISGLSYTLKSPLHDNKNNEVSKHFAWQNEGIWYSIEYYNAVIGENSSNDPFELSKNDIGKIALSIKNIEEIKNVDYSTKIQELSTEVGCLSIYDKEDLEKAKKLLGFNPKLPLDINKDITIRDSGVGITGDSDIKNNKINYELNTFYDCKNCRITFNQKKNSKIYEEIKKNGYFKEEYGSNKNQQVKAETIKFNDIEVYKYQIGDDIDSIGSYSYEWKENGIYYSVSFFFEKIENMDEIVKAFVNSKPIK